MATHSSKSYKFKKIHSIRGDVERPHSKREHSIHVYQNQIHSFYNKFLKETKPLEKDRCKSEKEVSVSGARFTERLITDLSPKTFLTTDLRPKTCLILKICIKTCHKSILIVN